MPMPSVRPKAACRSTQAVTGGSGIGRDYRSSIEILRESYQLTPETETETTVVRITGQEPGPTVYIAAGIHGDERAAWFAGLMLQKITIRAGTLYVLSPANAKGAKVVSRMVGEEDPNRCFPGQEDGTEAQRLCYAIFHDIEEKAPEQLLDLHEAIVYKEGRDFLGSTLIYSSLDGMQDMFFDLLRHWVLWRSPRRPWLSVPW